MAYARYDENHVLITALPEVGVLQDGSTVSGYHLLPEETLLQEGWKHLIADNPEYDASTTYLILDTTEETDDSIIYHFKAVPIPSAPAPIVLPYEPTQEDRLAAIEAALNELMLGGN